MAAANNSSNASDSTEGEDWKANLRAPKKDERARTTDVTNTSGTEFEDFGLKRDLLKGIFELGWEQPSPVQEKSIPASLNGDDILARAKNGTGKTGAYMIPLLQMIDASLEVKSKPQAIILVPARELALQTGNICTRMSKHLGAKVLVTTGGTQLQGDIVRLLQGPHVIAATPGRLLDLARHKMVEFDRCKILVLDEVSG